MIQYPLRVDLELLPAGSVPSDAKLLRNRSSKFATLHRVDLQPSDVWGPMQSMGRAPYGARCWEGDPSDARGRGCASPSRELLKQVSVEDPDRRRHVQQERSFEDANMFLALKKRPRRPRPLNAGSRTRRPTLSSLGGPVAWSQARLPNKPFGLPTRRGPPVWGQRIAASLG